LKHFAPLALFAAKNNLPGENSSRLKPALSFTDGPPIQKPIKSLCALCVSAAFAFIELLII